MTSPRRVLPGSSYLVSRRCAGRRFYLRPDALTTAIFRFVLAVASWRYGIRLHAFCVLSNHFHLVLTDPAARLPAFMQYLDSLVGRAVNASRGRWEYFWDPALYSAVALSTADDILEKSAYVLANPVAAGLVRHGREWPGLWSEPALLTSEPEAAVRPDGFFRRIGGLPARMVLRLSVPPGFPSAMDFRVRLETALAQLERRHADAGCGFLGAMRVLRQKWWSRPKDQEARRGLRPRVAGRNPSLRIEALEALRAFLAEYRDAWRAWSRGRRGVAFPPGTYALRVLHGARCRTEGAPA